jgi:sialate O-acetylesterase
MTIAGRNTIRIVDILIGEVWLGSGQSNMAFVVSGDMAKYPGIAVLDWSLSLTTPGRKRLLYLTVSASVANRIQTT